MKNNLFVSSLVLLLTASLRSSAQCPSYRYQPEFMGSYGVITGDQLISSLQQPTNKDGRTRSETTSSSGAIFLTAGYYLYSYLSVGMSAGYIGEQGQNKQGYGFQSVTTSSYSKKIVTIAFEINYLYRITKYMDTYTFLGVGPGFTTLETTPANSQISVAAEAQTTRSDAFRFHYSPIGIRIGGRVGAFAELGFGYKGLLSGGLSVRLGHRWCSKK